MNAHSSSRARENQWIWSVMQYDCVVFVNALIMQFVLSLRMLLAENPPNAVLHHASHNCPSNTAKAHIPPC